MTEEMKEYSTFSVTAKDGSGVELAVVDEFEFEHKNYVVGAVIDGDTINEDGYYIYRARLTEDDFVPEKITNPIEYEKIAKAYMEMDA